MVSKDEANTLLAAELTKQLNESGMEGVTVVANHTLLKMQEDVESVLKAFDEQFEELTGLRSMITKYRDLRVNAELTQVFDKVDTFLNEVIIPGVNGPRPEHMHLDRDSATSIIRAKERMCKPKLSER